MLLSFFPISLQGTKTVPYSRKGTTYEGKTYTRLFPGMALRDALHHALRAHPTYNGIRATQSTNAPTMNTLHTQQFSSQRWPEEFSRTESPARQGEAPVYPDASVTSLDHRAGTISAEMIVMVVQPHPAGGRIARWHCVPGDASLLPADVPPFFRGYYHLLTWSIPNGGGSHSDRTWDKYGKRRGRPKLKNVVAIWLPPRYWWSSSSTFSRRETPRLAMPKKWKGMSSLASPGATPTTPYASGTVVCSSLFGASSRRVPIQREGIAL